MIAGPVVDIFTNFEKVSLSPSSVPLKKSGTHIPLPNVFVVGGETFPSFTVAVNNTCCESVVKSE